MMLPQAKADEWNQKSSQPKHNQDKRLNEISEQSVSGRRRIFLRGSMLRIRPRTQLRLRRMTSAFSIAHLIRQPIEAICESGSDARNRWSMAWSKRHRPPDDNDACSVFVPYDRDAVGRAG